MNKYQEAARDHDILLADDWCVTEDADGKFHVVQRSLDPRFWGVEVAGPFDYEDQAYEYMQANPFEGE